MPPRHSRHRLLAGVGLCSLLAALLLLPLENGLPELPPGPEAPSVLVLGALGALLSGGWFLLGYALGSLLRAARPRPTAPPPPETGRLSRMTTEELYRELERMNRETLLYEPGLTRRTPLPPRQERPEDNFSSA